VEITTTLEDKIRISSDYGRPAISLLDPDPVQPAQLSSKSFEHPISNTQSPTGEGQELTWELDIPCLPLVARRAKWSSLLDIQFKIFNLIAMGPKPG